MSARQQLSRTSLWRRKKRKRCAETCENATCPAHNEGHADGLEVVPPHEESVPASDGSSQPSQALLASPATQPSNNEAVLHHDETTSNRRREGTSDEGMTANATQAEEDYTSSDLDEGEDTGSSEDDKDFEMHFLDEEPEPGVDPDLPEVPLQHQHHDPDPEDPEDNPDDPQEDDSESSDEEDEHDERSTFSLDHPRMNVVLQFGYEDCTVRDAIALNIGLAVRYNWTYEALGSALGSWSIGLGRGGLLPTSKKQLWKFLQKSDAGIVKHAYCPNPDCQRGHGKVSQLQGKVINCVCGTLTPRRKMPHFLSVDVKKQFEMFLSTPGVAELLQYRQNRRKHRQNAMEDIFDGEVYISLIEDNVITDDVMTYIINSDGFKLFKHRSMNVWGLLGRINELPPNMRQRHTFLFGIWIGSKEPNMNTFLEPFVRQANVVSREGVLWKPDGVNEKCTKFIPIGLSVDAPARAMCLNQKQFNGYHGCYACTHRGISLDGCVKYPILPFEDLPPAEDRTHQSIVAAMEMNQLYLGQKGPSQLMLLDHFDLAKGNCMDDLHPFYEGVAAFHFELLLPYLGTRAQQRAALHTINQRMKDVRTPLQMARKWMDIFKRLKWIGSQWGHYSRYFAPLCFLDNQLPIQHLEHLAMASYCYFVWSQDSIDPEDFARASEYSNIFEANFQEYHGPENMRFNVHMGRHAAQAHQRWGASWTTSTFNFESMNRKLGLLVTSAKGADEQIVTRHLLKLFAYASVHRPDISQRVRNYLSDLLFGTHRQIAVDIDDDVTVLGRGSPRLPTPAEQDQMQRSGFPAVNNVTEYDRLLVRGIEFRTSSYHEDSKSDNSVVYTWNNRFATIRKVVVVHHNDAQVCGLFVEQHDVDHPIRFAHHIGRITNNSSTFIRANDLRVPAIKMSIQNVYYVVPMANCYEID